MIAARMMMRRAAGGSVCRPSQRKNTTAETRSLRTTAENYRTTAGNSATPAEHPDPRSDSGLDVRQLVSLLRQENAWDVCVIRVAPELLYRGHMIIATGASPRHLNAMATLALKAFKFLRTEEQRHTRVEGGDCTDWKCIDFGSMVLHLQLPEVRAQYELEKLWTLGQYDEQLQRIPAETLPHDFIWDGPISRADQTDTRDSQSDAALL